MLLQLLVTQLTGSFDEYMQREVFVPLGMEDTGFGWSKSLLEQAAVPYDEGLRTEYFAYVGKAAAASTPPPSISVDFSPRACGSLTRSRFPWARRA